MDMSMGMRIDNIRQSLKEVLEFELLVALEEVKDEEPNFIERAFCMFFEESAALIVSIKDELKGTTIDYKTIEKLLLQLGGKSVCHGAIKICEAISNILELWRSRSLYSVLVSIKRLEEEYLSLKKQLRPYLKCLRDQAANDEMLGVSEEEYLNLKQQLQTFLESLKDQGANDKMLDVSEEPNHAIDALEVQGSTKRARSG